MVFDAHKLDISDEFKPDGVIEGWREALLMMVEGDKWELYIPSELAYGDSGQGGDIGAGDVLVFTLHLLKINGASTPAAPRGPANPRCWRPCTPLGRRSGLTAPPCSARTRCGAIY